MNGSQIYIECNSKTLNYKMVNRHGILTITALFYEDEKL